MEIQRTKPKFSCCACGLCCRRLNCLPEEAYELQKELDRGDGVCKYLGEDTNLCTIYEERPLLCRVDDFYDAALSDCMSRAEWYKINHEQCKKFQEEENKNENIN